MGDNKGPQHASTKQGDPAPPPAVPELALTQPQKDGYKRAKSCHNKRENYRVVLETLGLFAIIVGAVAAWLNFTTLQTQTDNLQTQTGILRDQTYSGQRAYLLPGQVVILGLPPDVSHAKESPRLLFHYVLKNTGQTPAKNVGVHTDFKLLPNGTYPSFPLGRFQAATGFIGKDQTLNVAAMDIDNNSDRKVTTSELFKLGEYSLKLWGLATVDYDDVFGYHCAVRACYILDPGSVHNMILCTDPKAPKASLTCEKPN